MWWGAVRVRAAAGGGSKEEMRRSRSRQEQEQQQQHMVAIWAGGATSGGMRGNDVSTASDRTQCVCVSTETNAAGEKRAAGIIWCG